jgi:hypothetical protein
MIIGRDLMTELGIDVMFSMSTIDWWGCMNASNPMKPYNFTFTEDMYIAKSDDVEQDMDRLSSILDAKYAPTDVAAFADGQSHLSGSRRLIALNGHFPLSSSLRRITPYDLSMIYVN